MFCFELADGCCLMPSEQFCIYIVARTSYILMGWWRYPICTRPTHVAPLGHIILIPSQTVFAFLNNASLVEKQQILIFTVYGLPRPGLEHTLKAGTQTITPPIRFPYVLWIQQNSYQTTVQYVCILHVYCI
jgi:hypothetical protein